MESLTAEFATRGPWVTRFHISGQALGGEYLAAADPRLHAFLRRFPRPGRILELGCLEGGHTLTLARVALEVVALEARAFNLEKARWLADVCKLNNIQFLEADLEQFSFDALGKFDVIFNVGLLYHLRRPWELLEKLSKVAPAMFLWTHVAPSWRRTKGRVRLQLAGYRGDVYAELGPEDPLSGTRDDSFWPTMRSLRKMLVDSGFPSITVLEKDPKHPHGPAVLLLCQSNDNHSVGRSS
ncbi:MAG: class I SAM-dependent methyltransferase [Planctomycetota bacterium]